MIKADIMSTDDAAPQEAISSTAPKMELPPHAFAKTLRQAIHFWNFTAYDRVWRGFNAYLWLMVGLPLLLLLLAWLVSRMQGFATSEIFRQSFLAYLGPAGIVVALAAYGWYARALPSHLARVQPAIEMKQEDFKASVEVWANRYLWLFPILFGVLVVLFGWNFTGWWTASNVLIPEPWLDNKFFRFYYGFFHIICGPFLLSSGLYQLIATLLLFQKLFAEPIRLDYHRRLDEVSRLVLGVGVWTMVGVLAVIISSVAFAVNFDDVASGVETGERLFAIPTLTMQPVFDTSTMILLILASFTLLSMLLVPILMARAPIIRAKKDRIGQFEQKLAQISEKIRAADAEADISALKAQRGVLEEEIAQIDRISSIPVTWTTGIQLIIAGLSPILTPVITLVTTELADRLSNIARQILGTISAS
jgi:hypothetical protein